MLSSLSTVHLLVFVLAPIACLFVFLLLYIFMRYRRGGISPGWIKARQYANQNQLSREQWLILSAMLRRFAQSDPFTAVTCRHEFDRCVREQINSIAGVEQREAMGETLREIRLALKLASVPSGERWSSTLDLEEEQTVKARPVEQENSPLQEYDVTHINDAYLYLTSRNPENVAGIIEGSRYLIHACHTGDARYEIIATVAQVRYNPMQLLLAHQYDIRLLQVRAHERSAYLVPTPMDIFVVPEGNASDPLPWLYNNDPEIQGTGTFMNMSAGGYAAMLNAPPPPNRAYARITITLGREDCPPFEVFSRIVGTAAMAENRTLLRGAFVDITPSQQEAIEQYVRRTLQQEQEHQTAQEGERRTQ